MRRALGWLATLAVLTLAPAAWAQQTPSERARADFKEKLKNELREELKNELREEVKAELRQQVKEEIKQEIKTEVKQEAQKEQQVVPKTGDQQALPILPGYIERLPPAAFPDDPVRGIPGGSLWMTFHGLQWPYMPKTGIGVSGYVWLDPGYETIKRGNPTEQNTKFWLLDGRLVLRITPTYSRGRFFVQGQAELVANKNQSQSQPLVADTDDLWIKVGMWKLFDLQIGRYEGWEVYHFGMGLDLYTLERNGATDDVYSAPSIYGLTYAFYRPSSVGNVALHVYPTRYLRFEVSAQFGNESGQNTLATRPVGVFDIGWLKLKAGLEYKKLTDQKDGSKGEATQRGVGAALQLVFNPYVEGGFNFGYGLVDRIAQDGTVDTGGSNTTWSVGGFINGRLIDGLLLGAGLDYTYLEDLHVDPKLNRPQKFSHTQTFGAIQYLLFKQLYIKLVVAYAKADFAPNFGGVISKNEMYSGRIRLLYLF